MQNVEQLYEVIARGEKKPATSEYLYFNSQYLLVATGSSGDLSLSLNELGKTHPKSTEMKMDSLGSFCSQELGMGRTKAPCLNIVPLC